jgi:hypothetical protein
VTALLAILICGSCHGGGETKSGTTEERKRAYILFVDLTLSLNDVQKASLDRAVGELFAAMPPESRIVAYPIAAEVQNTGRLLDAKLPDEHNAPSLLALRKMKAQLPAVLRANMKRMLETGPSSGALRRTCIADALRQASNTAEQFADRDVEVVLISDMLEDCPNWLLNGELSMEKPTIAAEMNLIGKLPRDRQLLDLRGARVTAIIPPAGLSEAKTPRPGVDAVREFWRAVLRHCNLGPNGYSLDTALPEHLRLQKTRH